MKHSFPITPESIAHGIRNTRWPARFERIQKTEWTGYWMWRIIRPVHGRCVPGTSGCCWREERPRTLIFSCLRDKPVAEMAQILFPLFEQVILAPIHTARAAALDDLLAAAKATGTPALAAESVSQALELAEKWMKEQGSENGLIVVSGSVYLVGEARTLLLTGTEVQP